MQLLWFYTYLKKGEDGSAEWKIVERNENGKIQCLDCEHSFSSMTTARQHHKDVHMKENKFICQMCDKTFAVEDYLQVHMHGTHMLPRIGKAIF